MKHRSHQQKLRYFWILMMLFHEFSSRLARLVHMFPIKTMGKTN